ncbi:MAG TPA: M48 family metalloprotease [Thermoanaerobaculia bacterium]|nr:M48 family metalloprotease [Thermoanaerobaculia bacterium]
MRSLHFCLISLLLLTLACSTNPATGQREFNIVSEAQEIALGRQAHEEVIQQFGIYREKPELNRLVDDVGKRIAAVSERPDLPWQFTVLDSPMVNAMALPGGYIYITRGMLERMNSVDEVAGVLGHEIAHVTARHAAQRISRAQLAQFGLVLGAVVAGPEALQQYGQLAELAVGLLFQRYSRGQETQADVFGTSYMAEAKFNPLGAEQMLMTLQRLDKNPAAGLERYFLSHPEPAKRVRDVQKRIGEIAATSGAPRPPERTPYIRLLDGVMTGNSTQQVIIKGNTIYDRDHGMILTAPAGWTAATAPGILFAMAPRGGGQSQLVVQELPARSLQGRNAQQAVRIRLEQIGLSYAGSRGAAVQSGQQFPIDVWTGRTQSGAVGVETTQFAHGDHVAVFMFVAPSLSRTQSPLGEILGRAEINAARARAVEPPRIRIGTVRAGESWSDIARRATGNAADAEAVANMNGFDLRQAPSAGLMVKLPQEVVREG